MLRIDRNFTLDNFEAGLDALSDGETILQLPNSVKADAVGGMAALIQLIITWARKTEHTGKLNLYAKSLEDEALKNFANTPFGLAALNMANAVQSNQKSLEIDRYAALEYTYPFVNAMHNSELSALRNFNKSMIPLLCLDNAKHIGIPKRLYQSGGNEVASRSDFTAFLTQAYLALKPGAQDRASIEQTAYSAASLVYEAFQNTHRHARNPIIGSYRRSIRGLLVRFPYIRIDKFKNMTGNSQPLQKHFRHWRPKHARAVHGEFMELSIFDSGPGLAQTWLKAHRKIELGIVEDGIDIDTEYDAVLECLKKGGTSKTGINRNRGFGLFRIMKAVEKQRGFIRIRTGRLSLIRAFGSSTTVEEADDITMIEDLITGGRPKKGLSWADGTEITVMLPMNRAR